MQQRLLEAVVGLFVLLSLAALLVLSMQVSSVSMPSRNKTYTLSASFENIGSLKIKAPITIAGVTIGRVSGITFDQISFQAVVTMAIDQSYANLPRDSDASINTAGLLGEQYIAIGPGGDPRFLEDGDEIRFTQSAVVLEQLIGQFIYAQENEE